MCCGKTDLTFGLKLQQLGFLDTFYCGEVMMKPPVIQAQTSSHQISFNGFCLVGKLQHSHFFLFN